MIMKNRMGLAAALLAALASPAAAQADDGWDMTQIENGLIASVDYASGQTFMVVCRGRQLDVIMNGVPVDAEGKTRWVGWTTSSGEARQTWISAPGRPLISAARPAHVARLLKQGGALSVRLLPTEQIERVHQYDLPLPTNSSGVDQVLAACQVRLDDPRDELIEIEPPFERPGVLGNIYRKMARPNYPPSAMSAGAGEVLFSCIVAEAGAMKDCRIERETPSGVGFGQATLAALPAARLQLGPGVEPGRFIVSRMRYRLD